jgi:hypothetical protein
MLSVIFISNRMDLYFLFEFAFYNQRMGTFDAHHENSGLYGVYA